MRDTTATLAIRISIIIIVLSIATSGVIFYLKNTAVTTRIAAEERLSQEKIAKDRTNEELLRAEKEKENLDTSFASVKKRAESLEAELAEHKRNADALKQRAAESEIRTVSVQKKIEQVTLNVKGLRTEIAGAVREALRMSEELSLIEKTTAGLKGRLAEYVRKGKAKTKPPVNIAETGELKKASPADAAEEPALKGEILTINREFDFIVVNLGKGDGVKEGLVLNITRDGKVLGKAEIETVRENISAASIIDKQAISQMRAGDKVFPAVSI